MGKKQDVTFGIIRSMVKETVDLDRFPWWEHKFFDSFNELDAQFKIWFGEDWRDQEWAKFWLRDAWNFETREHNRHMIHEYGKKFKQRTPGSVRDLRAKAGPKRLSRRVPPATLASFIKHLGEISLRDAVKAIQESYEIKLSHQTIRRIKKKYNL
jgi:hypothetical protein